MLGPALLILSTVSPALADSSPTAAEIDWRPRAELPPEVVAGLPLFCEGGYLPSTAGGNGLPLVSAGAGGDVSNLPIYASGLSARYEIDRALFLQGDVRLQQGAFAMTGDQAHYDQQTGMVALSGALVSRGEGFLLTGNEAEYDSASGQFQLNTATFLLHDSEMRGSARSLSRIAEHQVRIDQGYLTTCAPNRNDWAIVASEIELDQAEGFGTAKHVRLEVLDTPVFYWPYASFPIDDRRKTGFLYPAFGTSNAGSGLYVSVPYYLNLAPHYDATVTPQYIHGRGLFTEVEGRYLSRFGESVLQLGYIGNDGEFTDENPGEDGERWALDFETRASFGTGWRGYGDYSVVSDNDYLSDLNRSLDISNATHLLRRGGVSYADSNQYFDAYVSGYQTIADRILEANKPYAQLPEILYGGRTGLGWLETSLEAEYSYFYRDNELLTGVDKANAQRLRLLPELALPMQRLWGYARPSVTLDYTRYQLEDYDVNGSASPDRAVPVVEWDSGLYFDRRTVLFDIPFNQTLEPRLYYAWADADNDQGGLPDFDSALRSFSFDELFRRNRFSGGDRVGDANQMTLALTSRFNDLNSGAERARFSLGQIYYFDDREVTLDGLGASTRSESSLAGEAVLRPLDTLDLRSSLLWDPRDNVTEESRSQLLFHTADYRYLASLGYTYSRDEIEQSDIGGVVPVTDNVSLIGRWVYDSQLDRTVGSLAGLEYNSCCWSLQLVHQNYLTDDEELESRVLFQIQLKGLGGSGDSSSAIADAIYGFDERERRRYGTQYR
ncbi:LPS-assembly protein LptD [Marinobacter zhejiangensis]|uniref:LPS-assembly protein LptD n=1 Tax=Marinobacter zhejiangensis TaxID=488535 RepID=UPI001FDFC9AE|nr:LPS-assembly protein LptD [Marinobacter zhejiangensis]